jgi:hypothetical protein
MSSIEKTNELGVGQLGQGEPKYAVAEYDFAVDGGETGNVTLRGDELPAGAIIVDSLINVETEPESGGEATILLTAESEGDLQASKKVSEAPWSTATPKRGAVTATGTPVVTTAARSIVAKVGTAKLTAGKFQVVVTYLELA